MDKQQQAQQAQQQARAAGFRQFLTAVTAKLPEEQRGAIVEQFGDLYQQLPQPVQNQFDNGVMMRQDYSRVIGEHRQQVSQQQQQWQVQKDFENQRRFDSLFGSFNQLNRNTQDVINFGTMAASANQANQQTNVK